MSFVLLGILNSQAAAGGGAPSFLSSAPLWLDAADASTITESSGSVSQWDNKGTLENFSQATSADQPTTGVNTQNGLNVIDFASDFLSGSTKSQWKFLHDGTTYFVAGVAKFNSSSSISGLLGNNNTSTSNIGFTHFHDDRSSEESSEWIVTNAAGGGPGIVTQIDNGGDMSPDVFVITSAILDPDNATLADRIDYYIDNVQGSVTNTASGTASLSDPTFNLEIGSTGNQLSFMNGSIGELIIVSGADATETNRQAVVDYLNAKWSVF